MRAGEYAGGRKNGLERVKDKKIVGNRKIIMSDEVRHRIGKG
jgi:hypothetical protein